MDNEALMHGLMMFVGFVAFTSLHEYAHAWTAVRCGDDTPRLQGRLTLDPMAHIDWIGTIAVPLFLTFMSAAGGTSMMFGWGRPVEVNLNNFRQRRRDDILVSGAGPAMNLLIAFGLLVVMKIVQVSGGSGDHMNAILNLARLSTFLCFFNLLPIPPLDGGHIMRNLIGMGDEAYQVMSQYSFIFLIIMMRIPGVGMFVSEVTNSALGLMAWPFGWQIFSF